MSNETLLKNAKEGMAALSVSAAYKKRACAFLELWLTRKEFKSYFRQIEHLISQCHWEYLLDSFYQVIPFGTGGRRGEVGIGPNRINLWTIQASAQGHAQYLLKKYGNTVKTRGVVLAYDVRKFFGNTYLNDKLENPTKDLTSKKLAYAAAEVYAASEIKVYIFSSVRTTPELSFAIRHLNAVAGCVFSASHNPPDHNGKKVYDEFGGQLIPPFDEALTNEVTKEVRKIKTMSAAVATQKGLIKKISGAVDTAYIQAASSVSLSGERNVRVAYTPLHGCGITSVYRSLKRLGFYVQKDPKTSNPSGKFEHVTFHIPNPEVSQSFDTTIPFAEKNKADLILSSDPDADRVGAMVRHRKEWVFLNGNEIATALAEYVIQKRKKDVGAGGVIVKTGVTTDIIKTMCEKNRMKIIGDLLVGFKYVAHVMNDLEKRHRANDFLFACEESHGYLAGNYARDKDAITASIWLAELASELKKKNKTIIDYLNAIYTKYGYYRNYMTEIRLLGAMGREQIDRIQGSLRKSPPNNFGKFAVKKFEDYWNRKPIVSETDRSAKNTLVFHFRPVGVARHIKVTVRPSGTEPKIKMYFEIGTPPVAIRLLPGAKRRTEQLLRNIEKAVMSSCYQAIGVDFPERGFLLFSQLPLQDKLKYFTIEPEIEKLRRIRDKAERKKRFFSLVSFLGSNPIEKIDNAFRKKYRSSVRQYLNIR